MAERGTSELQIEFGCRDLRWLSCRDGRVWPPPPSLAAFATYGTSQTSDPPFKTPKQSTHPHPLVLLSLWLLVTSSILGGYSTPLCVWCACVADVDILVLSTSSNQHLSLHSKSFQSTPPPLAKPVVSVTWFHQTPLPMIQFKIFNSFHHKINNRKANNNLIITHY